MYLIPSIILVSLLVLFGKNHIKKYAGLYYIVAALLSVLLIICSYAGISKHFPIWIRTGVWPILAKSTFATTLFIVVMFTGAFPNGSKPQKHLMPIRGELSIIASILTLGHNISYGGTYFKLLFTKPSQLPLNQVLAAICSLIMLCIMLPLFITSFKTVRRKMSGRSWKKLQRLAYGFYALIYIHVLLLMMPKALDGVTSYILNVILYSVVFLSYAAMRLGKALKKKAVIVQRIPFVVSSILILTICCISIYPLVNEALISCESADSVSTIVGDDSESTTKATDKSVVNDVSAVAEIPITTENTADSEIATVSDTSPESSESAKNPDENAANILSGPEETSNTDIAESTDVPNTKDSPKVQAYKSGTFSGSGAGYVADITIKITIEDNKIVRIRPIGFSEDEPYWTDSKKVIDLILSSQSTDVDTISGATTSSKGIIEAVKNALEKAKIATD